MSLKYKVMGENGTCGKAVYLEDAIYIAERNAKMFGGRWIVVRMKDGKVVWRPGMSYEEALRECRRR